MNNSLPITDGLIKRQVGGWFIASRPTRHCSKAERVYIAWAKRTPIVGTGPSDEPDDVWFYTGISRQQALALLYRNIPKRGLIERIQLFFAQPLMRPSRRFKWGDV